MKVWSSLNRASSEDKNRTIIAECKLQIETSAALTLGTIL